MRCKKRSDKRNIVKKDLSNLTLNLKKLEKNKLIQSYQKEIINITGEINKIENRKIDKNQRNLELVL